ncbi:MAG: cob(I)yrinic acid a,c-diamide adenosyltransferase [Acidobacteriota bacterium]
MVRTITQNKIRKQRGLVVVFTGDGKGKTSAALGIALRGSGHRMKTCMIKFIKGTVPSGEDDAVKRIPEIKMLNAGKGFYRILGDRFSVDIHKQAAREGLKLASKAIKSLRYDIVILDEINVAVHLGLIPFSEVKRLIELKPSSLHLILTGRNARKALINLADMVTEMKEIKHPFKKKISAARGIDF